MSPDTTPPEIPDGLVPAFNELAARADAAQRLAITAIEMLADEMARNGRGWDLIEEADRLDATADAADDVGKRGRVIAAGLLRVLSDSRSTGKAPGLD